MHYRLLIGGLIVGLIVGGGAGYWYGRNKGASASVTATSSTSTTDYLSTLEPAGGPGITGVLADDQGQAYVNGVTSNLTDEIAYGLAKAASSSQPAAQSRNIMIPQALAGDCTTVAAAAVQSTVDSWLPHALGSCAEIDANYTASYTVYKMKGIDNPNGVMKVTLQIKSPSKMKWRDNYCNLQSLDYKIDPITVYYSWDYSLYRPILARISKTLYDNAISNGFYKLWCQGTLDGGAVIGDVTNCPRCKGRSHS